MGLDIPRRYETQIEQLAQSQRISTSEALDRVLQAGLERVGSSNMPDYLAIVEQASQSAHRFKTREEADRYLSELRAEW